MSDDLFDLEFAENADPRCAVSLILDVSDSMGQPTADGKIPIDELNSALDILVSELNKDPLAKRRVEVSIVTYGTEVSEPTEFATVDNLVLPTLVTSGVTSTGKAVETAMESIKERSKTYKENGIERFRPWALLLSDGLATDDISKATKLVKEMEKKKQVSFFSVGIEGADLEQLSKFSDTRPALGLREMDFASLFTWLSASQAAVSASNPGEGGVKVPSPAGWAEIDV